MPGPVSLGVDAHGHDPLLDMIRRGVQVVDLGRQLRSGIPQSPNHPRFMHTLPRRHGDVVRPDGGSAANDLIVMGTHVGTHIDALAHVSHNGRLHNGADAVEAGRGGVFDELGIHTVEPIATRGILLDVARYFGVANLDGGYEISTDDLEAVTSHQDEQIHPGDVVFIRSGWGRHFTDPERYVGAESGVPGVGAAGASWLADHGVHAVGGDTIAFECASPKTGHSILPAHRVLLVERGVYIIESLDLERLSSMGRLEFTLIVIPLNLYGATGSPVRPIAVFPF